MSIYRVVIVVSVLPCFVDVSVAVALQYHFLYNVYIFVASFGRIKKQKVIRVLWRDESTEVTNRNPVQEPDESDERVGCVYVARHHESHGMEEAICVCIDEEYRQTDIQNNTIFGDLPGSMGSRSRMDNNHIPVFEDSPVSVVLRSRVYNCDNSVCRDLPEWVVSRSRVDNRNNPLFGDLPESVVLRSSADNCHNLVLVDSPRLEVLKSRVDNDNNTVCGDLPELMGSWSSVDNENNSGFEDLRESVGSRSRVDTQNSLVF